MSNLNEQFSQLYDEYIDKIYRFVFLKVESQEIAEDITSKVFLSGWESYQAKGSDIKNPRAFLYQIARNSVIDYYREKGRFKTISSEIVPEMVSEEDDSHAKAILSDDISIVKKSIQKLKKDYQDIIIWHYLDDMPIAEIAQLLGKPEGTVRVALHRGMKDLKGKIQES